MRCIDCPLFSRIENYNGAEFDTCAIFGDEWDSQFQYEDESFAGCYIEREYIDKVAQEEAAI